MKKHAAETAKSSNVKRASKAGRVGSLTPAVNPSTRGHEIPAERALEALVAADFYLTRLVAGLTEIAGQFRLGANLEAEEALAGAVSGIHCLADILSTVARATGVEAPPSSDQELGLIALALQE